MENALQKGQYFSESDSCDNQVLLPVASLFPANDIITKQYTADTRPNMKLIMPEKREKKKVYRLNTEPQQQQYWECFKDNDTLGYAYAGRMGRGLAYLKFNNSSWMSMPGTTNCNYMAGLFIPLQRLLTQQLKKQKWVYGLLGETAWAGIKSSPELALSEGVTRSGMVGFSSDYQGGNLFMAIQTGRREYDLVLQNDINSRGNTQWFNFTSEFKESGKYIFTIVNLTKSSSLYEKGMRVLHRSVVGRGWRRGCEGIRYERNELLREDSSYGCYYQLRFEYNNPYPHDIVSFAYCYPYTPLDLERFLEQSTSRRNFGVLRMNRIEVAETLAGQTLYAYQFASKRVLTRRQLQNEMEPQQITPAVVIMGRQHPGESQGSLVVEGVIEWLLEGDSQGWRRNHHFIVIPMINMDGVTHGNYRTNLSGHDLNRNWKTPRRDLQPEVYGIKKYLLSVNRTHPISLIVDVHGHSNAFNSFFYGNSTKKDNISQKLFPYYCSRKVKQISFQQSTFSVSASKRSTARVVLGQMFPKAMVYTFQNSFYGWRKGKHVVEHTADSYRKLGKELMQCFVEYTRLCDKNPGIRQRWGREIQEVEIYGGEEVVSESDEEAERQLVEMESPEELKEPTPMRDNSIVRNIKRRSTSPSRLTTSVGKTRIKRYPRRNSRPQNHTINHDRSPIDREKHPIPEPQGFLSIVKINTRPDTCEPMAPHDWRLFQTKKSLYPCDQESDFVVEKMQGVGRLSMKENYSQKIIKVSRLMNEKQMAMERYRQKKSRADETSLNKTSGFLKLIHLQHLH